MDRQINRTVNKRAGRNSSRENADKQIFLAVRLRGPRKETSAKFETVLAGRRDPDAHEWD